MGLWTDYTKKDTPADNDTLMIYDATAKANKLSPFSGIWNWIVGKLTNTVISNLQTSNQTVVGALNELNSKTEMSKYYGNDLLIYAESLTTGRYFVNTTDKTKNSPCNYGFCIIYIVDKDRKIIIYDKTTNSMYANTKMNSGTAWIGWRKI